MIKLISNFLSLFFQIEKRRFERIPCSVNASIAFALKNKQHCGSMKIYDITPEGLGCSQLAFPEEAHGFILTSHVPLAVSFSLPQGDGTLYTFHLKGRIASVHTTAPSLDEQLFGIQFQEIHNEEKALLAYCISVLKKK